jgi:large subunit ribosomal protein L15
MKLHDLRPPDGSHTSRTRVGRGIAAGKGKTAGRGTKGQKARAGGSIPPWFEGGQTPLHMRIPKLRGFKNRFKVEYEVVNVGSIAQRFEAGAFTEAGSAPKKGEQLTINADILRAVGLVRDVRKPLKVLGGGELSAALFVVADAFTKSATEKIEAAGGAVSVLEVPAEIKPAIGVGEPGARTPREPRTAAGRAAAERKADARVTRAAVAAERVAEAEATSEARAAKAPKPPKEPKAQKVSAEAEAPATDRVADSAADAEPIADAATADADSSAEADSSADAPAAVDAGEADADVSPLEAADGSTEPDAPAGDIATETDAADTGENA